MGADFCFSWIAVKKEKEKTAEAKMLKAIEKFEIPELSENSRQKILTKLNDKKSKPFEDFCVFWENGYNGDFEENMPVEEIKDGEGKEAGINKITEKRAREIMKDVVQEFFKSLGYRDMGSLTFKGYEIYLSGGMSFGDEPSDSYNTINKLNGLPKEILEAGGFE